MLSLTINILIDNEMEFIKFKTGALDIGRSTTYLIRESIESVTFTDDKSKITLRSNSGKDYNILLDSIEEVKRKLQIES